MSKPFRPFLCNDVWIFRLQIFCFTWILPYGREALREAGMDSRIREKAFIKIKIMTVFTPRDTVFLIRRMVKRYSHSMPYMKWSHRVLRVQAMINSARPAARARKGVIFER